MFALPANEQFVIQPGRRAQENGAVTQTDKKCEQRFRDRNGFVKGIGIDGAEFASKNEGANLRLTCLRYSNRCFAQTYFLRSGDGQRKSRREVNG